MHERFEELNRQNHSTTELAGILGVTPRTIQRWRRDLGTSRPQPPFSMMPATPERLAEAKALLDDGAPIREVERSLHMSRGTVKRHFPGVGWSQSEGAQFARFCQRMNTTKGK